MTTCELCGDTATETYTLTLEWPAENPEDFDDPAEFDDPGSGTLVACARCADGVATNVLVDRAVRRGLDDVYAGLVDGHEPTDHGEAVSD